MRTGDSHFRYCRGFHLVFMWWVVALRSCLGRSRGLLVGVSIDRDGAVTGVEVLRCVFASVSPPAGWDGSGVGTPPGMEKEAE
jgi:hypothetical protein